MSIKMGKKIGFISALAMLIGSVVGIGIFFKSHGILRSNDWNGIGTLMAWLIGGILSLSAAVSFSEIGSMKTKNVHGLAGAAERVGGKKFGYLVRFNYSFFYTGILAAILGTFGSEMLFMMITTFVDNYSMNDVPIYAHAILGLGISAFFIIMNYLSVKIGGIVATVTTVLKWIPLLTVAILGLALATTNNNPGVGMFGKNAFTNGQQFSFTAMLSALPAVLFAYDAFLGVASMKNKMKNPQKLPAVVIIGMISIVSLYMFIAVAAILHGSGMVSGAPFGLGPKGAPVGPKGTPPYTGGFGIFDQIFNPSTAIAMGKFVVVFLVVSTFGVINGISAFSVAIHEQAIRTNTIFGAKALKAKFGEFKVTIGYMISLTIFWAAIFSIPAIVLNSDSIIDGISNFPTLFFFAIYGIVILLYTLKRNKISDTKKMNKVLFGVFAWTAIIGITFVVGYQLIYGFFIEAILHPGTVTHWGLFVGDSHAPDKNLPAFPTQVGVGTYISLAQASIVMFSFLAMFFVFPALNYLLKRKVEKEEVFINTQVELK